MDIKNTEFCKCLLENFHNKKKYKTNRYETHYVHIKKNNTLHINSR